MNASLLETGPEIRRHELLADMAEQAAIKLMELADIDMETASKIGNGLADFLAEHWKGQNIYFTADTPFKHSKRDLDIFRRMGRGMAPVLAAEFNISYVRVYQIYRRMLDAMRARVQPDMFVATGLDAAPEITAQDALATTDSEQGTDAPAKAVIHSPKKAD